MRSLALLLSGAMSLAPAPDGAGKAEGTLTVAKAPVKLLHVFAQAQKGFFDPKSDDVLVLLTDVPLAGAVLNAKGQAVNVTVRHKALGGPPVSGGSTEDVFEPKTHDGKTLAGRLFRKSPGKSFDDVPYTFDVTFSTPVAPKGKP